MMKEKSIENIKKTLADIAAGKFDSRNIENLFIHLRDRKGTSPIVREIGHFIAHEERDRGATYKIANSFANGIMQVAKIGGILSPIPVMISQQELLRRIKASLLRLHFTSSDISVLDNYSYEIMREVIEILSGSSFVKFGNKDIARCELSSVADAKNILRLYIKIFPVQTGEETSLGGNPPLVFGPDTVIGAEVMRAIPSGESETDSTRIMIGRE